MESVEEYLVFSPRLLVRGLTSPLTDVVVENLRLFQKGDPFGHHHDIGDGLLSCLRKFFPLLQLFNQSGNGVSQGRRDPSYSLRSPRGRFRQSPRNWRTGV